MIVQATLVMGIILGTICLLAAVFNFVRHQSFGLGGVVLVAFGAMLLGLSIWQSIELSIDADGSITAKYKQDIGSEAAERNSQLQKLRLQVKENQEDIERIRSATSIASVSASEKQARKEEMENFDANSKYSVLVFNKSSQEDVANRISNKLLGMGFKASATETDLIESKRQLQKNEAWVIYTSRGMEIRENIKELLSGVAPDINFIFEPNPVKLRRGDMQILLF